MKNKFPFSSKIHIKAYTITIILNFVIIALYFILLKKNNIGLDNKNAYIFFIVISSCITILMLLIVHYIVKYILHSINTLKQSFSFITNKNQFTPLKIEQSDEIGELFKAYNEMIDKLKSNMNELEQRANDLELNISKRTIEMEEIHNQLIQAGKLAAVGELAAGVAHEINNPIGGILGYSQYILEKMGPLIKEGDKTSINFSKYIEFIAKESRRCKSVIHNLLKFSRSSNMEFSNTDINVLLIDTVEIAQHQIHIDKMSIEKHLYEKLPLIKGDASQLQQVFLNIIINSIKAIPINKEGLIKISTNVVEDDDNKFIEIQINDNGCGIPVTVIDKIFNPFFTTRATGDGTGLGLSLSYGIIKDHQGDIKVISNENEGTTFFIRLPILE